MKMSHSDFAGTKPPILILDGGLGTTLQAQDPAPPLDKYLWSSAPLLTDTSPLSKAHKEFADAGADIISTATYQISFPGVTFMDYHDDIPVMTLERAKGIMRSAVGLAREAADSDSDSRHQTNQKLVPGVLQPRDSGLVLTDRVETSYGRKSVALSLGPYGATMNPSAEYSAEYDNHHSTFEALELFHLERLQVFTEDPKVWQDVDYVAFETFGRVDEIRVARQVMTEVFAQSAAKKSWWISCVFPDSAEEGCLPTGESIDDAVEAMLDIGIGHDGRELERPWGIGINCTKVSKVRKLLLKFEAAVKNMLNDDEDWPALLLYPDGTKKGEYYDTALKEWVVDESAPVTTQAEKAWYKELRDIVEETSNRAPWRAVVVGGCCRTGPDEIERLRMYLHASTVQGQMKS